MVCVRTAASVLAVLAVLVAASPAAGASAGVRTAQAPLSAQQGSSGADDEGEGKSKDKDKKDKGGKKDPCDKKHPPPFCAAAPEAPAAILYPGVGVAVVIVFLALERRRRIRTGRPG